MSSISLQDIPRLVFKRMSNLLTREGSKPTTNNKLLVFLLGTIDSSSALRRLRGQEDILRIIWTYACSEWWDYHIQRYYVPSLPSPDYYYNDNRIPHDPDELPDLRKHDLFERKQYFDAPFAIVDSNLPFPSLTQLSNNEPLYVNMMPFDLFDPFGTLPENLYGYVPIIEACRKQTQGYVDTIQLKKPPGFHMRDPRKLIDVSKVNDITMKHRIAYLTVDERPTLPGHSQRRGGVHVESPGAMREKEVGDKSKYTPDLCFYHPWGLGRAQEEFLDGGIFICSNISDSTAIWKCRIHDTFGDIIGAHGSLERMRDILGPADYRVPAGELVWLSDRTPHESLPLPPLPNNQMHNRQFFRLVVGEIGFWFSQHNTVNPTGFPLPAHVPVIDSNKFISSVATINPWQKWECGTAAEIELAAEAQLFREKLYQHAVGFLSDPLLLMNVYSIATLKANTDKVDKMIDDMDPSVYSPFTKRFMKIVLDKVRYF